MVLYIIIGVVVAMTVAILGVLFFILGKEGAKLQEKREDKAVPITDLDQLKSGLSSQLFEQHDTKVIEKGSEIIPVFTAKVSLPTQEAAVNPDEEKYKLRAQHLEDELLAISKKAAGQSDEAQQLIQSLTLENEPLKAKQDDFQKAQDVLSALQGEASVLKVENLKLESLLESTNAKAKLLEEEMAALKVQMGEEISRANAMVADLTREKEFLLSAPKPVVDESLGQELDALKFDHAQLRQKFEELEKENKAMQYELIKARAQSSGLERVSFNYKNQLEDFFKKINAVQVSNEQLAQVKNRLEGMVEEVKLKNEELVQKDRLAQFELEKSRMRVVSIEREYEELKSKVQQQNP